MYIITLQDEPSGIYSVFNDSQDRIIPLFEQEDDALRYLFLLEGINDNPDLEIREVEPDLIITVCRSQGQKYSIITADDLIIPPPDKE
tara:strand:+ start:9978 stop:10241 length:264 start_codon:yes stop_codon:yes gene_type:complete